MERGRTEVGRVEEVRERERVEWEWKERSRESMQRWMVNSERGRVQGRERAGGEEEGEEEEEGGGEGEGEEEEGGEGEVAAAPPRSRQRRWRRRASSWPRVVRVGGEGGGWMRPLVMSLVRAGGKLRGLTGKVEAARE